MNREIKFRAYQKTPSLNHKPSLYEVTGLDLYEGDYGGGEVCLRNKKGEQWTEYIKDVVLEQDTGLKDKNGKDIYEGDILKIEAYHCNYRVVYRDFDCCFCGDNNGVDNVHLFNSFPHAYEVIGNIHENPELLEDK